MSKRRPFKALPKHRERIPGRTPSGLEAAPLELRQLPTPVSLQFRFDHIAKQLGEPTPAYVRTYELGDCHVIVTREHGLWHLSISARDRYPTWHEITQARYRILPDQCTMAILLPPQASYININPNVFQLVELRPERLAGDVATGQAAGNPGT